MQVYPQFNGIATQHAHNIFLDALINFGILGVGPLIIFIVNRLKEAFRLCDIRKALVLALTVIVDVYKRQVFINKGDFKKWMKKPYWPIRYAS